MKYLGVIIDPKDLVTKEYVDNAVLGGTSTFYKKYENTYVTSTVPISTIPIGMGVVTSADMLFVDINGLDLIQDVDYTISGTNIILTTPISKVGQNVHIILLRMVNITASDYNALKGDPGDISDVLVNNNSVVSNGIASITPSALINIFYPVGSYYETSDTTFNPNVSWGGTWSLETEGQVHVSSGANYTVGGALTDTSDGGSKDAILVSHNHTFTGNALGNHDHTFTGNALAGHSHRPSNSDDFIYGNSMGTRSIKPGTGTALTNNWYGSGTHGHVSYTNSVSAGTPSGTVGGKSAGTPSGSIDTRGESGTDKNMQPYIVVNRWHRTA